MDIEFVFSERFREGVLICGRRLRFGSWGIGCERCGVCREESGRNLRV